VTRPTGAGEFSCWSFLQGGGSASAESLDAAISTTTAPDGQSAALASTRLRLAVMGRISKAVTMSAARSTRWATCWDARASSRSRSRQPTQNNTESGTTATAGSVLRVR
jgi:hypothetical protein